jgi:hypothetical protein
MSKIDCVFLSARLFMFCCACVAPTKRVIAIPPPIGREIDLQNSQQSTTAARRAALAQQHKPRQRATLIMKVKRQFRVWCNSTSGKQADFVHKLAAMVVNDDTRDQSRFAGLQASTHTEGQQFDTHTISTRDTHGG